MASVLIFATALALRAAAPSPLPAELHVCCGCGSDASATPHLRATPLDSLAAAQSLVQLRRRRDVPLTVYLAGRCAPPRRVFTAADGGDGEATRVVYRSYEGEDPAVISGGVPLPADALQAVTDPAIVAQISPAALPFVRQVDLAALGVADLGSPQCHAYMGGEASILPGNLVSAALEVMMFGDPTIGGDLSPLTLARWPNRDRLPKQWANGTVDGYTISVDCATAERLAPWAQQLREDPGSIFVHYLGGLGWDDHHNQIGSVVPPPPPGDSCSSTPSSLNCSDFESGFDYDGNDLQSPVPADSQQACCALCGKTAGCRAYSYCTNGACAATNCYLKSSSAGRKAWPNRLSGPASGAPAAPKLANITLNPCPSKYQQPGFDSLDNGGTYCKCPTSAIAVPLCSPA